MNNLNNVNFSFPIVAKIQGAFEYSSNKSLDELTAEDIKVYAPRLDIYFLKQPNLLEENNVVSSFSFNLKKVVSDEVDHSIEKKSKLDSLVLAKNLEKLKAHVEKELIRLQQSLVDNSNE